MITLRFVDRRPEGTPVLLPFELKTAEVFLPSRRRCLHEVQVFSASADDRAYAAELCTVLGAWLSTLHEGFRAAVIAVDPGWTRYLDPILQTLGRDRHVAVGVPVLVPPETLTEFDREVHRLADRGEAGQRAALRAQPKLIVFDDELPCTRPWLRVLDHAISVYAFQVADDLEDAASLVGPDDIVLLDRHVKSHERGREFADKVLATLDPGTGILQTFTSMEGEQVWKVWAESRGPALAPIDQGGRKPTDYAGVVEYLKHNLPRLQKLQQRRRDRPPPPRVPHPVATRVVRLCDAVGLGPLSAVILSAMEADNAAVAALKTLAPPGADPSALHLAATWTEGDGAGQIVATFQAGVAAKAVYSIPGGTEQPTDGNLLELWRWVHPGAKAPEMHQGIVGLRGAQEFVAAVGGKLRPTEPQRRFATTLGVSAGVAVMRLAMHASLGRFLCPGNEVHRKADYEPAVRPDTNHIQSTYAFLHLATEPDPLRPRSTWKQVAAWYRGEAPWTPGLGPSPADVLWLWILAHFRAPA